MTTFALFVLVAIAFATALTQLGRFLRRRGHGPKLDRYGAIYNKMQNRADRAKTAVLGGLLARLTRRKRWSARSNDSHQ